MDLLKQELLKTISLFEPMSLEKIYLDLDKDFLLVNHHYSMEDLLNCLLELSKEKKIRTLKSEDQNEWIKIFPKRKNILLRLLKRINIF